MNYFTTPSTWLVVLITLAIVVVCIVLHYEVLSHCNRFLPLISHRRRRRVIFLISIIVLTHVAEMWIFAFACYGLVVLAGIGTLTEMATLTFPDYVYYSAMVYTTVGFGDIVPGGAIRFLTGMEALTGLVMITWSASFTFLEMQRDWPRGNL